MFKDGLMFAGVKKWQEYSENNEENVKRTSRTFEDDDLMPLQENVLSVNFGLDMVVAITKVPFKCYLFLLFQEKLYRTNGISLLYSREIKIGSFWKHCASVGSYFVHEFEARLELKFITYDLSYRGIAKWFGVHYNKEAHFSSAGRCKEGPYFVA